MAPGTELKYVEAEENNQSFSVLKHKHKVQKIIKPWEDTFCYKICS